MSNELSLSCLADWIQARVGLFSANLGDANVSKKKNLGDANALTNIGHENVKPHLTFFKVRGSLRNFLTPSFPKFCIS